jgi:hypothetical protein
MVEAQKVALEGRLEAVAHRLEQLSQEVRAVAIRLETLHGKLDATIEIRERLGDRPGNHHRDTKDTEFPLWWFRRGSVASPATAQLAIKLQQVVGRRDQLPLTSDFV